jgi:hypothetical protein
MTANCVLSVPLLFRPHDLLREVVALALANKKIVKARLGKARRR